MFRRSSAVIFRGHAQRFRSFKFQKRPFSRGALGIAFDCGTETVRR
jgi:hypothetical protein